MEWRSVPKAELHVHLEGAPSIDVVAEVLRAHPEVAEKLAPHGLDHEQLRDTFCVTSPVADLAAFLGRFWHFQAIFCTTDAIQLITQKVCEDAVSHGVRLLELRYSPAYIASTHLVDHSHLSLEAVHAAVVAGIHGAQERVGRENLAVGLLGVLDRCAEPSTARTTMDFIVRHRGDFVGVDLANDERFDAAPFAPLFKSARAAGLRVTAHAGEAGRAQNVLDAMALLGAERIGHGISVCESPTALAAVRSAGVVLEVCPSSNVLTGVVASYDAHPIAHLRGQGVKVCVNTDDPGIFNVPVSEEYRRLACTHAFALDDFAQCNQTAVQATFVSPRDVAAVRPYFQPTAPRACFATSMPV